MDIRERETAAHDVREETSGALTRIRVLTRLHLCGVDGETGESVELCGCWSGDSDYVPQMQNTR